MLFVSKLKFLSALFVVFALQSQANAATRFFCYSVPGTSAQFYEYASNCSSNQTTSFGVSGEKTVQCLYQAVCEPAPANAPAKVPALTKEQVMARFDNSNGPLKVSQLVCRGTGIYEGNRLMRGNCPAPTECQRDVFYNFGGTGPAMMEDPTAIDVTPQTSRPGSQ